jgi:prepilin-type N-terminal cleavage/methylation domain-containing protein
MTTSPTRQHGVSLLEALVAMAVMAIGAVAVLGLQTTLRLNGDVAKQRSEAVRLAQQVIEDFRGFTRFDAVNGVPDWTDIVSTAASTNIAGSNVTFLRDVIVVANGAANDDPLSATVHVTVNWTDRANQAQAVELNTIIAGVHPEFGGALSIPMVNSMPRNPFGRNPVIPRNAVDQGDGTSLFNPPGAGTVHWVFDNGSGLIVKACSTATTCTDIRAMLLAGFVRFSTGNSQPTPTLAESPTSPALSVDVVVEQDVPYSATQSCFEEFSSTSIAYFCLVPVNITDTRWTGIAKLSETVSFSIADSVDLDLVNDPISTFKSTSHYKVCRYTTVRSNSAVVPDDLNNEQHPSRYVNVDKSLTDQNFLVIKAGNGSDGFVCPDDNLSTNKVNGSTWHHQPSS